MVLEYFTKKQKKPEPVTTTTTKGEARATGVTSPVLSDADEDFFKKITSEENLNKEGKQIVIFEPGLEEATPTRDLQGADTVALPKSPEAESVNPIDDKAKKEKKKVTLNDRRKSYLSYVQQQVNSIPYIKKRGKDQENQNVSDLAAVATSVKTGDSLTTDPAVISEDEAQKEKDDLTSVLDQLNLSAVNNKAFSFSKESQRLLEEFTQILKDLINGVPTAYDDLEKLLTNSDKQLKGMFDNLPPFLQNLVKTLPTKLTATVAPGLLAAVSEQGGADAKAASGGKSLGNIPLLKNLVKGDAIAGLLKGILNFLKLRFPLLVSGTNILLSLAVFLLLFVFWYCHKRGKETRLEKEAASAQGSLDNSADLGISKAVGDAEGNHSGDAKLNAALNQKAPSEVPLPGATDKDLGGR